MKRETQRNTRTCAICLLWYALYDTLISGLDTGIPSEQVSDIQL
jgi:hypothetical protein